MAVETPDEIGQASSTPRQSDEQLLAGFVAGDHAMLTDLVQRYERPLYGLIARYTGAGDEAEDLFQETFLRVFQHADGFGGRSSVRTWLYSIALNVCRGYGRGQHPAPAELPDDAAAAQVDRPGPDELAAGHEIGERIAAAVRRLPPEQCEVFVLRVYEDLKYDEIAQVVGRPVATVKSQMRLAVQKLRKTLRKLEDSQRR